MKTLYRLSLAFTSGTLFLCGCAAHPEARVVRLQLVNGSGDWLCSINGGSKVSASSSNLVDRLSRLGLHHGDIVLFGTLPVHAGDPALAAWQWLSRCCDSNHVAAYAYEATTGNDTIFSIPVYHWLAPFNNPRGLAHASFFYEGHFLGYSTNGYQNFASRLRENGSRRVFVLGSLYDFDRGFGPNEVPYEKSQDLLEKTLKATGVEPVYLHPLPGL